MEPTSFSIDALKSILLGAERLKPPVFDTGLASRAKIFGLMTNNPDPWETRCARLAAARLNAELVVLGWRDPSRVSTVDLLSELQMASHTVDLLLTSYIDLESLGGGRRLSQKFSEYSACPLIHLSDEIYNHQSALTHLSLIHERLGSLYGRRITVTWGFGDSFVQPSTVHSLMFLGSLLGAQVQVLSPPHFEPLRRVLKKSRNMSSNGDVETIVSKNAPQTFSKSDAVIALNWCSLEEYGDLERNRELARTYRDWYLTTSLFSENTLFLTEPPVQSELIASPDLLDSNVNLTPLWLRRRAEVLAATVLETLRFHEQPK